MAFCPTGVMRKAPGHIVPFKCISCGKCVEACPVEAIKLNDKLGTYFVDRETCTACGACVDACPYNGCWIDPSGSYSIKCDLCDGDPQCVAVCPKGVLKWGD
mgnify:CR=1 FL=1